MHRTIGHAGACLAAVLLGACAKGDQPAAKDTVAAKPAATALPAAPNIVLVRAKDFAFEAPDQIPAGMTTFRMINDGPGLHHVQFVRLDSGKTAADFATAMKAPGEPPHWIVFVGGPNAMAATGESNATMDMTAGNYVMLCFVDFPDHVPHFTKGMVKPLTVTPSTTPSAPAPTADVVVTLNDYSFTLSTPVSAGKHTFEVRNTAKQPHEIFIVQLAPGKTAADFKTWLGKMAGPPPGRPVGGTAGMVPGISNYFTADITPGNYVLMCFVPDAKDGKPHLEHGMFQEVKVN
ncbi:MAG: cupredoxin domain-containing protein [Gemmatimonadota bacterium]|nr:cupredoxin domain-containing protein [Gemmatimonadota bacterium]